MAQSVTSKNGLWKQLFLDWAGLHDTATAITSGMSIYCSFALNELKQRYEAKF